MFTRQDIKRFQTRVNKTDTCWLWTGGIRGSLGYGAFWFNGSQHSAHRISYEIYKGDIPNGLVIDHTCKNPPCVNPEHLEAVTQGENLQRSDTFQARNKRKTHCPMGHEYNDINTWISKNKERYCRACARIKARSKYIPVSER